MNTGTPVTYTDKQNNEWAGQIVGRTWDHHQPEDDNGQPVGPVVRNETGRFNVLCVGHDGQSRFFEGIAPGDLTVADLDIGPPVFETRALRRPPNFSGRDYAPVPVGEALDMGKLAQMVSAVVDQRLAATPTPPAFDMAALAQMIGAAVDAKSKPAKRTKAKRK